jgi:hypothetical protein
MNPKSFFVAYCLNRIALESPTAVAHLPPGLTTYRTYAHVLRAYLDGMEHDRELLTGFIAVIVTDDLTITHAAFVCHHMADANLAIKVDERIESHMFRALFEQIMLRLDSCDDGMIELLTTEKPFTAEALNLVEGKCGGSGFLRHLIGRKIKRELFRDNVSDEIVTSAIHCLSLVGRQALARPDDVGFLPDAVRYLKKPQSLGSQANVGNLALVLRALQEPFFVDAALPELLRLIRQPELTECTRLHAHVESLIICEVAWFHPARVREIADNLFRKLTNETQLRGIYGVFQFLASIGFAVEIIQRMTKAFPPNETRQVNERREFLTYFLKNANPPYTAEFVNAFSRCLAQENFRCLVIADRPAGQASRQMAQLVFEFCRKVENVQVPNVDEDSLERLSNLQAAAKRIAG